MRDTTFRPRSWAPRVLGVISILMALPGTAIVGFSSCADKFTATYGGLSVVQQSDPEGDSIKLLLAGVTRAQRPDMEAARRFVMLGKLITWGLGLVSLLLLAAGIGQVLYLPWGRPLSVAWGVLAIVVALVMFILLVPAYNELGVAFCDKVVIGRTAQQICPSSPFGKELLSLLIAAIYPLVNVIYFSSESAHEAMG